MYGIAKTSIALLALAGLTPAAAFAANVMLGAFVNGGQDDFVALEGAIGHKLAIDFVYMKWDWAGGMARQAWDIREGRTPLIAWAHKEGQGCAATAADIIAGKFDAQFKSQAAAAKSLGGKILIEFIPEMTDQRPGMDCFYGQGWDTSDAGVARAGAAYVGAEHRVVSVFRAAGATNVQWVFTPAGRGFKTGEWTHFYPGNEWVDWIGLDHHIRPGKKSEFPDRLFMKFYRQTAGYGKPLMLAQTRATANPGDQEDAQTLWLTSARAAIPSQFPALRAFIYDDNNPHKAHIPGREFHLGGSGLQAFKAMADDPNFSAR